MLNNGIPVISGFEDPGALKTKYHTRHLWSSIQRNAGEKPARLMDKLVSPIKINLPGKVYSVVIPGRFVIESNPEHLHQSAPLIKNLLKN